MILLVLPGEDGRKKSSAWLEVWGNRQALFCKAFSDGTQLIVHRDHDLWSIGWDDEADGPFESRSFAQAVLNRRAGDRRHSSHSKGGTQNR